jgi:hypothetical protein
MTSNYKSFDTWRDTSEIYAHMLMAGKGRNVDPEARLIYTKVRASRKAGWSMWRAIAITAILATVWWFADLPVRTYAGWGAILLTGWSVLTIGVTALCAWEASRTASRVMSQLTKEE